MPLVAPIWASKNWNGLHGCTFSPSLSAKGLVTKGSAGPLEVDNVWELFAKSEVIPFE